jgi:alkaline phosphatase D
VGDHIYEHRGVPADPENGFVRSHDLAEPYTVDDYRRCYPLYKLEPLLQAAHAASPWLVTSDDHEVDNDYAGAISEDNDDPARFLARRAAAYQAYYEHMPVPRRLVPFGPYERLYTNRAFGSLIDLYMLDNRQYRSDQACGGRRVTDCDAVFDVERTMLGEAQERWLDSSLANTPARWTLLAPRVVFAYHDTEPGEGVSYWAEDWNGYMAARQRLMDSLAAHRQRCTCAAR